VRQVDLAGRARVSQSAISRLELGRGASMSVADIARVADALDIRLTLDAWWRGGDVSRLLDAHHASIVDYVVGRLRGLGWHVRLEYGFNHFGERGSVDIVAWHAMTRTLLLIEVKSRLADLQELLATFARKLRIVPRLVADSERWAPLHVGRLIVLPGTHANRAAVERHANIFEATYPARAAEVHRWLRRPVGAIAGIWFVSPGALPRTRTRDHRPRRPAPGQGAQQASRR
jgi:transcriptional regulator with XRE-family HTH domain